MPTGGIGCGVMASTIDSTASALVGPSSLQRCTASTAPRMTDTLFPTTRHTDQVTVNFGKLRK